MIEEFGCSGWLVGLLYDCNIVVFSFEFLWVFLYLYNLGFFVYIN